MTLAFPLRTAWRATRGAWRHFLAFFACIALGVAALVSVGTFAASLDRALAGEAKALTGGDVELRSARPPDPAARGALERLRAEGATTTAVRELAAMARNPANGASLLVELKAVEAAYPLYGRVTTAPSRALGDLLGDGGSALVERSLLERLGLAVGDPFLLGAARFTIAGVIDREPDRASSFVALGPRVMIAARALEATGLVGYGSRVRYRILVRLPAAASPRTAVEALEHAIADPSVRVTAFDNARPGLRRFFSQLATYLGLVGLASLLVGGIGVASSVVTFVRRQLVTVAVLKCLGAESRMVLAAFLLQVLALGLVGSLAGAAFGVLMQPVLVRAVQPFAPFALEAGWDGWTIGRGLLMGTLTALLCALWPLLAVREVPPSLVLRRGLEAAAWRAPRPWGAALPIVAGLTALAFWQAGSFRLGAIFVGAALAALAVLAAFSQGLIRLVRRLPPPRGGLAWRQGLAGLRRPGGHAVQVVLALGTGTMLLVAVALLEASLRRQIAFERKREAPSFFFIDVQPDQREPFGRLVTAASGGVAPVLTPIVRGRLKAIDGTPVTHALIETKKAAAPDTVWYFAREYVLTSAAEPPPGTSITRGRWWTAADAARRPRVSLEEAAAKHLGVSVGGTLAFDVQGVTVEAEVMSLRKVDWQSLTTNFFAILSGGALDGAPVTYMATVRVPASAETRLQDHVVAAYPNVTAIPVRAVLERVATVLAEIGLAIRLIALFSIAVGTTVMASTLVATRYQRLYETVILKTLGATRATVACAFAVEYACLGVAAGLGGTLLASALAWAVLTFVLDVPWTLEPGLLAWGVAGTTAGALAVGGLGTFRLLGQSPLAVLREE